MKAIEGERSSPIDRSQISSRARKKARSQSDIMQCAAADTYVGARTHTHPSFVPNGEDERDGTDGGAALIPAAALWSTDLALCWLCSACQCERERRGCMPGGLIMGRCMPLPMPLRALSRRVPRPRPPAGVVSLRQGRGPVRLRAALIRACAALTGAAVSPGGFECRGVRT